MRDLKTLLKRFFAYVCNKVALSSESDRAPSPVWSLSDSTSESALILWIFMFRFFIRHFCDFFNFMRLGGMLNCVFFLEVKLYLMIVY